MWAYGNEILEELLQNPPAIILFTAFYILSIFLLILGFSLNWAFMTLATLILLLIIIFNIFANLVVKSIRKASRVTDWIIYVFYNFTSYFGLSWIRPIILLIALASLYGKKETIRSFIYKHLPDSVAAIFYPTSKVVNWIAEQIISIIPGIASMQKEIEGFEFITLLYYSFSAYLIYQFVMAIRRKVRR